MSDYPAMIAQVNHVEPVPRRVRAMLAGETVVDTTRALYVWEWPNYPQYYIPVADVTPRLLVDERHPQRSAAALARGTGCGRRRLRPQRRPGLRRGSDRPASRHGALRVGRAGLPGSRRTSRSSSTPAIPTRGSTRSARPARFASSWTGRCSPTRPRRSWSSRPGFRPATTSTAPRSTSGTWSRPDTSPPAPTRATTSGYWSIRVGETVHPDLAWAYDFPTRQLLPIAGLIAFYNERVDIVLDGERLERPKTHFFRSREEEDEADARRGDRFMERHRPLRFSVGGTGVKVRSEAERATRPPRHRLYVDESAALLGGTGPTAHDGG